MNPKHAYFINSTFAELEMALQINVQRGDVFEWLKEKTEPKNFDIVFLDPPFELEEKSTMN